MKNQTRILASWMTRGRFVVPIAIGTIALVLIGSAPGTAMAAAVADDADAEAAPLELSLETCINLGVSQGLDYLTEEENYILQELATALQRHDYGRFWTGTVSTETDSDDTTSNSATVALAKRLLTGGRLQLSAGGSRTQTDDGNDDTYTSSVGLDFEQPLLRGAGRLVAREDLTQAERQLVYAWRDLTLFRQQFLIELVTKYYRLVQLQLEIRNQQERVTSAEELATLTLARLATGTASRIDMLRSVVNLLRARNDLVDAHQRYQLQLDSLKLDLGLAMDQPVTIIPPEALPYVPRLAIQLDLPETLKENLEAMAEETAVAGTSVVYQTEQAGRTVEALRVESVAAAIENRLDLMTAHDESEDARRAVRIARNDLRGDLDLTAHVGYTAESATSFDDQRLGDPEWSIGLAYEVPLDRVSERTSYRQQLIRFARAMRRAGRVRDQVLLDVRTTVRDLHRSETTVLIQQLNVAAAEQRLERARADNERGLITNRDVIEAQNELLEAKNALDRAKVDHIIATLQLEKDTGRLDPSRWREQLP